MNCPKKPAVVLRTDFVNVEPLDAPLLELRYVTHLALAVKLHAVPHDEPQASERSAVADIDLLIDPKRKRVEGSTAWALAGLTVPNPR